MTYKQKYIQGDQKNEPPSRAMMKSSDEKLSNAFSNTTYLDIIWRVSSARIHYLRFSDSFNKIGNVLFV